MNNTLFIEKYKPNTLDEIIGNDNIITSLKLSVEKELYTSIIFYGDIGIGKTITAINYAKTIVKSKENCIIYNAYDDRNQTNIKTKLDSLVKKKTPDFKVVLFDEFDSILESTQSVIFEYLEQPYIIFIFIVNKLSSILDSIQKRCLVYCFKQIPDSLIFNYIKSICVKENIEYTDEGINSLVFSCNGDIRVAINNLNLTFVGFNKINNTNIFKICNIPEKQLLIILVENIRKKNLHKALLLTQKFMKMGYNTSDIIINLFTIVKKYEIDEEYKIKFLSKINKTLYNISSMTGSDLQLYELYANMCN